MLRRVFGPKRDEVTGEWRKLYSGELHKFYCARDKMIRFFHMSRRGMTYAEKYAQNFCRETDQA
jgi:hypothetical protein